MCKIVNFLSGIVVLLCISTVMQAQEGFLLHSHTPSGLTGSTFRYLVSNVDTNERAFANAVDSLGRTIVAGYSTETDILVARYLSDGRFDSAFGEAGIVKVAWPATEAHIFDAAIDSQDRIVVVGEARNVVTGEVRMLVCRLTTDGFRDETFGMQGCTTVWFPGYGRSQATSVIADSEGRVIIGGFTESFYLGTIFAIARLEESGRLDVQFGGAGRVLTDFNTSYAEGILSLALDPTSQYIVAGGFVTGERGFTFGLARYVENGSLDSSFGNAGKLITTFPHCSQGEIQGITLDDNRVVAVGVCWGDFGYRFGFNGVAVARYLDNGDLDSSFGEDGRVVIGPDDLSDALNTSCIYPFIFELWGTDVTIDSSGGILVAGIVRDYPGFGDRGRGHFVARLVQNGELDTTFGVDNTSCLGVNYTYYHCYSAFDDFYYGVATDIAIDNSGQIILSGSGDYFCY